MLQLDEQCIILEMEADSKEEALQELAEAIHHRCDAIDIQTLVNVLKDREQVGSTGVGNGVAIPHGKIQGLEKLLLCFGRSRNGVSFDAIDNRPVYLFILILSPT
ncbi:MAG: PTS sugar transporter subunit IIA, partial [Desulfobulbaceae bacterium]|nr:PTS sugar transporter subunit IIA [Desulfobulbaceae bacterium]